MTVEEAEAEAVRRLSAPAVAAHVRESAAVDAQALLKEVLQCDRTWLILHSGDDVDDEALQIYGQLIKRRMAGIPVAYLTHKIGFYRREFYVDERVLVPRPETEHIVEVALAELRPRAAQGEKLAACDIGTGSGVIAISIAGEMPDLAVTATDVSTDAIAVASANARDLGVAERVKFLRCDLLEGVGDAMFDCVLANLPYVKSYEIPRAPSPLAYEPRVALDGGEDGLYLYRRLLPVLRDHLRSGALVVFEAAPDTVEQLADLTRAELAIEWCKVGRDYAKLGRFVVARVAAAGREKSAPRIAPGIIPPGALPPPVDDPGAGPGFGSESTGGGAEINLFAESAPLGDHVGHDADGADGADADWTTGGESDWLTRGST